MLLATVLKNGKTFVDTLRNEQAAYDKRTRRQTLIETAYHRDPDEPFAVTPQMVRVWGPNYEESEYQYLEEEFADWCAKTQVVSKSEEELIRAICMAQLNVRTAQANGSRVEAAMKALTDLMANCNLTPKQKSEQENLTETQATYGQFIRKLENERPISEPDEEFKDPDRIKWYIKVFFFGHLAKALGIKNDDARAYEQEMAKNAVTNLSESESEKITIDDIFGSADDSEEGGEKQRGKK